MKTVSTNSISLLLVGVILNLTSGVAAQAPSSDATRSGIGFLSRVDDAAIRKVQADYDAAWNSHDMTSLDSVFRRDAEFINVVGMH